MEKQLYKKGESFLEIHLQKVSFLGHITGAEGMFIDKDNVTVVTEWPAPKTSKNCNVSWGLQISFVGLLEGSILLLLL